MDTYIFRLNLSSMKRNRLINTCEVYKNMFEYTLKKQIKYYDENKEILKDNLIIKEVTKLKKTEKYADLNTINAEIINHAIHSATKYFIKCASNNDIPKKAKESMKDLHFYTNGKRIKIDLDKKTIYIDKIKTLRFFESEELNELKGRELDIRGCMVYYDKEYKDFVVSVQFR